MNDESSSDPAELAAFVLTAFKTNSAAPGEKRTLSSTQQNASAWQYLPSIVNLVNYLNNLLFSFHISENYLHN